MDNPQIEVTFAGLTHQCQDPDCHVPAFIDSLRLHTATTEQKEARVLRLVRDLHGEN